MPKQPNESFHERYEKLVAEYGPALKQLGANEALFGDVIEIWEDFERLHPLLNSIMEGKADAEQFRSIMFTLEAWSWHTADHLNQLYQQLSEANDDPA